MSERQKTALITGCSSGIGFHVARELAQNGYKVYACARRVEPMEPLKEFGVVPLALDVVSAVQVSELRERLEKELPEQKLDVLFNNAGNSCTFPAVDVPDEAVAQVFEVNVFAPVRMVREFSPLLINAKGTILFTGSLAGIVPFPFGSIYGATKAAIHQYAASLHLEMGGLGVRVINVITGGVDTNIADTRPLPETSILNIPEGRAAFDYRKQMSHKNKPMSPAVYAKKVVADILSSGDPLNVYRGTMATIMSFVVGWVPTWILEWGLRIKFKLNPVFAALNKPKNE